MRPGEPGANSREQRRVGPYEITVREGAGFGGPGFGGLGMPRPPFGFPVRPLPFKKGFPIPVPNMIPGEPVPAEDDPKLPAAVVAEVPSLVAEADLENLAKQAGGNARTRLNALHNISNLKGDLTQTDLTPRQASIIANYVVRIPTKGGANITELDEAVPYLKPLVKSRNFLLGLADGIDHEKADQQASEAVTGAVVGQLLLFSKDENWRLSCRKLVMRQAAEMSGKKKTAATEAEETLRDLYKEQSILLGMDAAELEKLVRPSQVMESAIKHLAAEISKQDPAPETKEYLDQVPRHLLAAKFVAQNDLEHTAMLQRIWIRVLVPYLEKINPKRINEMRQVQQDMIDGDRLASNVLEQLRDGEEKILRVWGLALDLK